MCIFLLFFGKPTLEKFKEKYTFKNNPFGNKFSKRSGENCIYPDECETNSCLSSNGRCF